MAKWNGAWMAALGLAIAGGCGDDGGAGGGTETETGGTTSADTDVADTMPDTGIVDDTGDNTGDDTTTGGVPGDALEPCDPRDDEPCDIGTCSGAGHSGYYCRPTCSNMASAGDSCGSDDVCLDTGVDDGLACFNVDACDFVTGDGCGGAESCAVLSFDPVRTACVPSESGALGDSCGPAGALSCDSGLGCLGTDLDDGDAGGCQQWCEPDGDLPEGCVQCVGLTDAIGTCSQCSVLQQDCADDEICNPINELLGGACVPAGPAATGEACTPFDEANNCELGNLCIELVDDITACVQTCDPTAPACDSVDAACIDLGGIVEGGRTGLLGVCIEGATQLCDPEEDPPGCTGDDECLGFEPGAGICGAGCDPTTGFAACGDNEACFPAEANYFNIEPFVEGNGACGLGCGSDADCGGQTCLLTDGLESDGICGTTCTPPAGGECAATETCVATAADAGVGACIEIGDPCDPDTLGGNCPAAAACVAVDGGAAYFCAPPCFEQDPAACQSVPDQCQVKTEPSWHGGVCVGGGPPCDPVAQGCGPGSICTITGGSAIGGLLFACDDSGPIAEGNSCEDSDCDEGLVCLQDTCRVFCDLAAADTCATGACTDVSAIYYLAADTLGACL